MRSSAEQGGEITDMVVATKGHCSRVFNYLPPTTSYVAAYQNALSSDPTLNAHRTEAIGFKTQSRLWLSCKLLLLTCKRGPDWLCLARQSQQVHIGHEGLGRPCWHRCCSFYATSRGRAQSFLSFVFHHIWNYSVNTNRTLNLVYPGVREVF